MGWNPAFPGSGEALPTSPTSRAYREALPCPAEGLPCPAGRDVLPVEGIPEPGLVLTVDENVLNTGGENVLPGGENVLPGGENVLPGGENVLPGGESVLPGGENVLPGGRCRNRWCLRPVERMSCTGGENVLPGGEGKLLEILSPDWCLLLKRTMAICSRRCRGLQNRWGWHWKRWISAG